MLGTLLLLILLVVLSIYSTFIGAEKAQQFFNTLPLTVYWIAFALLLVAGTSTFKRLWQNPWLCMIHSGIVVTLVGAMWSSQVGHELVQKLFNIEKTQSGYMALFERTPDERIMSADMRTQAGTLPFKINLLSFWLEYYRTGPAVVTGVRDNGQPFTFELSDEYPQVFDVNDNIKFAVLKKYDNFKVELKEGAGTPVDQKGYGENPALEFEIQTSEGFSQRGFLFEKFPEMNSTGNLFSLRFSAGQITDISDYKSYLQVLSEDGTKPLAAKIIQVNDPLEFGGYHFYQHSYEPSNLRYTVLAVVSNSGLFWVYLGFWMLGIGIVGLFWIKPIVSYFKLKKQSLNEH
ncbi:MAG: cytochrome c biogenesis protein ResB [Planctomycetota bacterium]